MTIMMYRNGGTLDNDDGRCYNGKYTYMLNSGRYTDDAEL